MQAWGLESDGGTGSDSNDGQEDTEDVGLSTDTCTTALGATEVSTGRAATRGSCGGGRRSGSSGGRRGTGNDLRRNVSADLAPEKGRLTPPAAADEEAAAVTEALAALPTMEGANEADPLALIPGRRPPDSVGVAEADAPPESEAPL